MTDIIDMTRIEETKQKMETLGYYPTRLIVLQTILNLKKAKEGGQVGQGIHAICLDGPPGAGKSFYAKTYRELLKEDLQENVEFISYQCNKTTGKAELYEEINVPAAIIGDANKVIISGKLVQGIDAVNDGKKVIIFIDEFDKAREETDDFLLNFLQDGEVDTTQRGKVKIFNPENYKNLQVIICKNDNREKLSGPLTRRLKFLKLEYMKPDILCKTINNNKVLKNVEQSIKDSIILLYTSLYDNKDVLSRLPSCAECMQAIADANVLMSVGADEDDIVLSAILSNMLKDENDIEVFKDISKRDSNLMYWYNSIIKAMGKQDYNSLKSLKEEMARNFFPEELRKVSGELLAKKKELENQISKYDEKMDEIHEKEEDVRKREKEIAKAKEELAKKESETKRLRESAQQDAIKHAEELLQRKQEELEKKIQDKHMKLEEQMEETRILRENAEKDALDMANRRIEEEERRLEQEFYDRTRQEQEKLQQEIDRINEKIAANNELVNQRITDYDYIYAKKQDNERTLQEKEEELMAQKKLLEKLLGRPLQDSDLELDEAQDKVKVDEKESFDLQGSIANNIQNNSFIQDNSSVFEGIEGDNWVEIGKCVLEEKKSEKDFVFTDSCIKKLGDILTNNEKFKKYQPAMKKDGMVLYQKDESRVSAVRTVEQDSKGAKNVYSFYSNTLVIPLQALWMIGNMIGNLNACGVRMIKDKPIDLDLHCLLCSSKQHSSNKEVQFKKVDDEIYSLQYKNIKENNPINLAKYLISENGLNISLKGITDEQLEDLHRKAFIKHNELLGGKSKIDIPQINSISPILNKEDRER